jgi:hypothetical protein
MMRKHTVKVNVVPAEVRSRRVPVTIVTPERRERVIRATVTSEGSSPSGKERYAIQEYALSNVEVRAEMLKQALRELAAWRGRYAELGELKEVFEAAKQALREHGMRW